jgi:hypothetical protein
MIIPNKLAIVVANSKCLGAKYFQSKEKQLKLGDHNDLLEELAEQSVRLRDLLKLGEEQQQRADELLVDADGADSDAQEAVRLGDKTLAEAQEINHMCRRQNAF